MTVIFQKFNNDSLNIITISIVLSVFSNFGNSSLNVIYECNIVQNHFFPSILMNLNPLILVLGISVLAFFRKKFTFFIALICAYILTIHPITFSNAEYVIYFYIFLWLFLKDKNHSLKFARFCVSFIFIGAAIGKLTPGWISGNYPNNDLYRFVVEMPNGWGTIAGEFLLGIAFLLPFSIGTWMSIILISAMQFFIKSDILQATLPIIGVHLTLLSIHEINQKPLKLIFDAQSVKSKLLYDLFELAQFNLIHISYVNTNEISLKKQSFLVKIYESNQAQSVKGCNSFIAVFSRMPIVAFIVPVLRCFRKKTTI